MAAERYPRMKWWIFGDDDNYFHLPNFLQQLHRYDARVAQYRSPVRHGAPPRLQTGMWHHPECRGTIEMRLAQPLLLSKPALQRLRPATSVLGELGG